MEKFTMKTKLKITITTLMAVLLLISIVVVSLTACGKDIQTSEDANSIAAMLMGTGGESTEVTSLPSVPSGCEVLPNSSMDDKSSSQASAVQSTAGSKDSSSRPTSTPGSSTAPPTSSVAPKPPASSTPPVSAPWTPNPANYAWVISYAKEYGVSIGMVWSDHGSKETSSWGSPPCIDDSVSNDVIKTIVRNNMNNLKQIQLSHDNSTAYFKIYMEPYEYDKSLLAIYFLY